MSTSVSTGSPEKNTSSWVRPGVCEVRASALRLVSALIRLDLPTLERPAKAISTPCMAGSDSNDAAADRNRHSAANSLRPVSLSSAVNDDVDIDRADRGSAEDSCSAHSFGLLAGSSALSLPPSAFNFRGRFLGHSAFMFVHSSILAPCFFMMMLCWATESELFHAQ